ncbi:uncharacterized protein LOC107644016 isoform X1 [Arachis ipaensis]|uniref:uncharacterized protein LOC107644016 isoform X1 n=2 Tax=Arachis ipaensis TaxID=130454 RepID=UPI0007AF423B|nr:uncharacterized protein LOC107644016 isoform X1 [Arachis ipaensis]XP_020980068.1 uncharacterized protein LOC107644016 isoform X1 [Arachis ipaensis]XP_020980069.1 uncharacterized protein LOC107644016 isoform X1 [Arachis ipaensis]XP_025655414.1 uncharacterized protein LOC112750780 isoform X1 [Arachis hypogaea]XP_025655415.1 uncharacterized protein LOC112750780 isoform X1 [Arachis hypogaea]XP_029149224.1 uncharacterized protein LOC112750780 isoform X1 [Arachis hypogaea]
MGVFGLMTIPFGLLILLGFLLDKPHTHDFSYRQLVSKELEEFLRLEKKKLENLSPSSDLPPNLVKKLKENHSWFVDLLLRFKPPSQKPKEALNSKKLKIGFHKLTVKPELKDKALQINSYLLLDEVQSYILIERSIKNNSVAPSLMFSEFLHMVSVI